MAKVLVTGGSGFLGSHCVLSLLRAGHDVRTTVRDLSKAPQIRSMLETGGAVEASSVSFIAADLKSDAFWADAVADCDYVLHVASPFPASQPLDENELISPARDGALRVLRAARDAGVKRVVLTSSFAAVGYGMRHPGRTYTEDDWTEVEASNSPYIRSKTIAERAAWDFMESQGGDLELTVINPTGIFGPVLGQDFSTSIGLIKALLEGIAPGPPATSFGIVDVRDVANLHLLAMTHPLAGGERFLAVSGTAMTLAEVADIIRSRLGASAKRVPVLIPEQQVKTTDTSPRRNASNAKARNLLGWSPMLPEDAMVSTAESLFRTGLVTKTPIA